MARPFTEDPSGKRQRRREKFTAFDNLSSERTKAGLLWQFFRTLLQHTDAQLQADETHPDSAKHQLYALSRKSDMIQYEECQS